MEDLTWIDGRGRFWAMFDALNRSHGQGFATYRPTAQALHRPKGPAPPPPPAALCTGPFRRPIRLLLVPGLGASLAGGLGEPLSDAAQHVRSLGARVETLEVRALASSRRNGRLLARRISGLARRGGERTVLLGYSKGATDALMALADHPALAARVDALVSLTGSIGGSLLADDLPDRLLGLLDRWRSWRPLGGLRSLESRRRRAWLRATRLPERVRLYSIVAHTARDRISDVLRPSYERLRLTDPKNDGQVLARDQIIPGSTLLAELDADHWAVALPLVRQRPWLRHLGLGANDFPREILLEAILRVIEQDLEVPAER